MVSFHAETANGQAFRLIDNIRSAGMKCGLVVNPETQLDIVTLYLDRVDKVTIMTVDPGFAGQAFISAMLKKIAAFAEYRQQHQLEFLIEVDGSCNKNTYSALVEAGADVLIVGSSGLFGHSEDIGEAGRLCNEIWQKRWHKTLTGVGIPTPDNLYSFSSISIMKSSSSSLSLTSSLSSNISLAF